jgi:hypothetical protein
VGPQDDAFVLDICVHAVAAAFADTRALLQVAVALVERLRQRRSDSTATPVAVLAVQRAISRLGSYRLVWSALHAAPLAATVAAPAAVATGVDDQLSTGWMWQAFREADMVQLVRDLLASHHTSAALVLWTRHQAGAPPG